ncbi:hypothetical protein QUA06_28305, partial [Microcoleus sp. POL8_C6]
GTIRHSSQKTYQGYYLTIITSWPLPLDELHCSHIPTYIATYERLQKLSVETVYPGHYRIFGQERYHQIMQEYLDRRRQPGCPSEPLMIQ